MPQDASASINLELAQQLCLEAGRIMEDLSAEMALAQPPCVEAVRARAERLHRAAQDIMALAEAARAIVR